MKDFFKEAGDDYNIDGIAFHPYGGNASTMLGESPSRAIPQASGWINGTLTPVITGNSVNSAIFTIRATIWKQRN